MKQFFVAYNLFCKEFSVSAALINIVWNLIGTCVWKAKNSSGGGTTTDNTLRIVGSEPQNVDVGPGKSFRNFRFDTASIIRAADAAFAGS